MKFCDVYCCFENCDNQGVYQFNFSKYHKSCKAHLNNIALYQSITCSYCKSNCRVINAIVSARPLCEICSVENTENEYTNLCLNCYKQKRCTTCFHITKKPSSRDCGHEYCEVCVEKCFICNSICNVCLTQDYSIAKSNCGHSMCSNCSSKECSACYKGILCVKCRKNCYFKEWVNSSFAGENNSLMNDWVCKDCGDFEAKKMWTLCQNCNNREIVKKRECSHDYCKNCCNDPCSTCQPCNYCQNYSSLVSKPCSHQFCSKCSYYPCPYCCQVHNKLFNIPECTHPFCSLCQEVSYCTICQPTYRLQESHDKPDNETVQPLNQGLNEYEVLPDINEEQVNKEKVDEPSEEYKFEELNQTRLDPYSLNNKNKNPKPQRPISEQFREPYDNKDYYTDYQNTTIDPKMTACENCGKYGRKRQFKCYHMACEFCVARQTCKACQDITKTCIMCPKKAQKLALFECGHDACWECIEKVCKYCKSTKKSKCYNCNKNKNLKRMLNTTSGSCDHLFCFECIKILEGCPRCPKLITSKMFCIHSQYGPCISCNKFCNICNDLLKYCNNCNCESNICSNSHCENHKCPICQSFISPCCDCGKTKPGGKCQNCSRILCVDCSSLHDCQKINCLKCEEKIIQNVSNCIHPFCETCFEATQKTCHFCHPSSEKCDTCLLKGFTKMLFDCCHLGCSNCKKNKSCFDCSIKDSKLIPRDLDYRYCCRCKEKTYEVLNLLCDHFVCKKCSCYNWKLSNYLCIFCFNNGSNKRVCLDCKQDLIIKSEGKFFIKGCCNCKVCWSHLYKFNDDYCQKCSKEDKSSKSFLSLW